MENLYHSFHLVLQNAQEKYHKLQTKLECHLSRKIFFKDKHRCANHSSTTMV